MCCCQLETLLELLFLTFVFASPRAKFCNIPNATECIIAIRQFSYFSMTNKIKDDDKVKGNHGQ